MFPALPQAQQLTDSSSLPGPKHVTCYYAVKMHVALEQIHQRRQNSSIKYGNLPLNGMSSFVGDKSIMPGLRPLTAAWRRNGITAATGQGALIVSVSSLWDVFSAGSAMIRGISLDTSPCLTRACRCHSIAPLEQADATQAGNGSPYLAQI